MQVKRTHPWLRVRLAFLVYPRRDGLTLADREPGDVLGVGLDFVDLIRCPVEVCERRDTKGLYRKARLGELEPFTGVDDPYEEPLNPEVIVSTDRETVEECVGRVIRKLEDLGWLHPSPA